ncbi:unnamed protein product [Lupinus luteus]|uniref:Uncharacterized protein n=1 Tax=Lupinus luteus TaxID=3873 RepID=A0AAV1Y0F3_LUPLU
MALGAERLMRLFECTKEKITTEFDYFFKNTWDSHENGHRIDLHDRNLFGRNNTSPVNVMNASNYLPFLSPPPPLPGFPPPPPPPHGFEHAIPYGVPPVNVPSRSYNMLYSGHDKSNEGFCSKKNVDGASSSCNSSSWNNSSAGFLSHLMNLNYGRICENPQLQGHFPYLSAAIVPPFHYPMDVAPMRHSNFLNNMPHVPPPPHQQPKQFPHHGFNPSSKKRRARRHRRSGGIVTFQIDPMSYQKKMSYPIITNDTSFQASISDSNSDKINIVPDNNHDTSVISNGTNEASNQGEYSNKMENVEGDSEVPSPHQSPTTDSPGRRQSVAVIGLSNFDHVKRI